MASQLYTIRLIREDTSIPWGFRIEGGIDIGHAVNIQRITPGSIAERCGLQAGDHVVRINRSETKWMKHEDVKMEIIRSCNDIEMTVQRGGTLQTYPTPKNTQPISGTTLWTPKVVSSMQMSPIENRPIKTTHTSLQASPQKVDYDIGSSHNVSPTPFGRAPPLPGQAIVTKGIDGRFRKIGHSTYNSPMGLYNQKNLNQVFEQTISAATGINDRFGKPIRQDSQSTPVQPSTTMYCGACGGFIRGVFVKVQGRVPMHPECLKCCKCGIGLRNVGYFYIKEQLYCETHAKQAAPPPEPGMKPVVVYK